MTRAIEAWGIHWFRRDLRLIGNKALDLNRAKTQGRTLGIFCFDSQFLSRSDFSHNRFAFFLDSLQALRDEMKAQGGDLLVVDLLPKDFFPELFSYCSRESIPLPQVISWGRDYEPFAIQRDENVRKLIEKVGVPIVTERDHLIFEPDELTRKGGEGFYQVYSPFGKSWFEKLQSPEGLKRIKEQGSDSLNILGQSKNLFRMKWNDLNAKGNISFKDTFFEFQGKNQPHVTVPIPKAGYKVAFENLSSFKPKIKNYLASRDFPIAEGTSKLSIFLKNGSLTSSQIVQHLSLRTQKWDGKSGPQQFLKEIAWREFYYSILYHCPRVESESFLPQFKSIAWENNEAYFRKWQDGLTGFPIVDAGMRELKSTGWMHNRVRMIVASFLTKDLLVDWKWGENHFMKLLLDGDLAANNGGWQWAASTGCDPQPYFRIFNPWLQGQKFDPDGLYIKRFVPELANAPVGALHKPEADRTQWRYPKPIVDHSVQRAKALLLYSRAKQA